MSFESGNLHVCGYETTDGAGVLTLMGISKHALKWYLCNDDIRKFFNIIQKTGLIYNRWNSILKSLKKKPSRFLSWFCSGCEHWRFFYPRTKLPSKCRIHFFKKRDFQWSKIGMWTSCLSFMIWLFNRIWFQNKESVVSLGQSELDEFNTIISAVKESCEHH